MKANIPLYIEEVQDRAAEEYDSPALDEFLAKAASTATEVDCDLEFLVEINTTDLAERLELVRALVEKETPSNANTVVNLFKATQLASTLTKVVPLPDPVLEPVFSEVKVTDAARRLADKEELALDALPSMVKGTGKDGAILRSDVEAFLEDADLEDA